MEFVPGKALRGAPLEVVKAEVGIAGLRPMVNRWTQSERGSYWAAGVEVPRVLPSLPPCPEGPARSDCRSVCWSFLKPLGCPDHRSLVILQ